MWQWSTISVFAYVCNCEISCCFLIYFLEKSELRPLTVLAFLLLYPLYCTHNNYTVSVLHSYQITADIINVWGLNST